MLKYSAFVRATSTCAPSLQQQGRFFFFLLGGICGTFLISLSSCSSDTMGLATASSPQAFWALQLNQHAVTMAVVPPYNTIQLNAVALTATGSTLTGLGPVQYKLSDTTDTSVTVNANGLVTARHSNVNNAQPVTVVVASLTDIHENITHVDTVVIQVTQTGSSQVLSRINYTLQPNTYDGDGPEQVTTPTLAFGVERAITVSYADISGDSVQQPEPLVHFTSSDPIAVALIATSAYGGPGFNLVPNELGTVTIYADCWWYGVERRDSLKVTIAFPVAQQINVFFRTPYASLTPQAFFFPGNVTVRVGAVVTFVDTTSVPVDIIFDDASTLDSASAFRAGSADIGGGPVELGFSGEGNIQSFNTDTTGTSAIGQELVQIAIDDWNRCLDCRQGELGGRNEDGDLDSASWVHGDYVINYAQYSGFRARAFSKAGTYHYHDTQFGTSGTIVVK